MDMTWLADKELQMERLQVNLGWKETKSHYNLSCTSSSEIAINISPLPSVNKLHKRFMPTWWIKSWRKLVEWNVVDETGMCCCSVVDGLVRCTECLLLDCWRDVQLSVAKDYATSLKYGLGFLKGSPTFSIYHRDEHNLSNAKFRCQNFLRNNFFKWHFTFVF